MKVVLAAKSVYPFHPIGGVQKYVYNFAQALFHAGVDVEIVAPLDNGKPRSVIHENIKYTLLKPSIYRSLEYPIGWLGVHAFSRSLANYLRTIQFDLLHAFDVTAYQYLKVKNRRPVVAQIFSDNYLCNPIAAHKFLGFLNSIESQVESIKKSKVKISPFSDWRIKRQYFFQYLLKIKPIHDVLKKSNVVFFEEESFQKEVVELFRLKEDNGQVLPVGINLNFIHQALAKAETTRKTLGFKDDDIILITVNRLAADKGVDKIVLALKEIVKINFKVKLIVVGTGYQEKELLNLIDTCGLNSHVKHFKNVGEKDLYAFYGLSDIYISAFSYLGSSVSTLEAMACGLPIVTTGQPWLVSNKENGIFVHHNDPAELKEAILEMIQRGDLKKQGIKSQEMVKDYDWTLLAASAIKEYEKILK